MQKSFKTYQLFIFIKKELNAKIGKLGIFTFPPGYYVYTGSAKNNLDARIKRHKSKNKKIRWHIDYLLSKRFVKVVDVRKFTYQECVVNQSSTGKILVPQFGASDCRNHCGSHLIYLGKTLPNK